MTQTASTPFPRRLSLFHLALLTPWVALVIDSFDRIVDNSFLWHIRAGELQLNAAEVLTADPFSFTKLGEPWITQSWLAEVFYGWAESWSGVGFTAPMLLVVGLVTIAGVGLAAHRSSQSLLGTATVVVLTTILMPRFLVPRPVLFSYPLLVLTILTWERRSTRWTLPFIFWIWASIHASFAIGLVYLALVILARRDWKGIRLAVICGAVTLFTAHGFGIVQMLLDFARSREYLALVSEWQTPDFLTVPLLPIVVGIVLLVWGGATKGRLESGDLWVIAPFLLVVFSSERAVATGWLVIAPFIAKTLHGVTVERFRGFSMVASAPLVAAILAVPLVMTNPVEIDTEAFPVAHVEAMDDVPTFHDSYVGGYLIWEGSNTTGVFIDDRVELYQERVRESVDVRSGREPWQDLFARDGIRQVLLGVDAPLVDDLIEAGWTTTLSDDFYVLLVPAD